MEWWSNGVVECCRNRYSITPLLHYSERRWRRGRESNPRIEVLQTPTLPLGYPAMPREQLSNVERECQRSRGGGDAGQTGTGSNAVICVAAAERGAADFRGRSAASHLR